MWHNRTVARSVLYRLSPSVAILACILATIVLAVFFYIRSKRETAHIRTINEYSALIREFIIERGGYNDNEVHPILGGMQKTNIIHPNFSWHSDTSAFNDLNNIMMRLLCCTIKSPLSIHYKSLQIWDMLKYYLMTVMSTLPTKPTNYAFPWGENWYEFSIGLPTLLVSAAYAHKICFGVMDKNLNNYVSLIVANYYENPRKIEGIKSMGWLRDGANAVMMAVPYIGGRLLMKSLQEDNICKYVRKQIKINYVTAGEGLYRDGGYIFHTTLRAYGYLTSAFPAFKLLSKFFAYNSHVQIYVAFEKLFHPTIPRCFGPWFSRTAKMAVNLNQYGKLGFHVIDSIRGVVAKTADWILAFNGQREQLCYYECDKINTDWAPVWYSARIMQYAKTDDNLVSSLVPYYPGVISYGLERFIITSDNPRQTTVTQSVASASCIICSFPGAIGMRNKYRISHANMNISVIELCLITENGHHAAYKITGDPVRMQQKVLTISANMGKFGALDISRGSIGTPYSFERNVTYVHSNNADDKIETVQVPGAIEGGAAVALLIKPAIITVGLPYVRAAYSTIHGNSNVNELIEVPTIGKISTAAYTLKYSVDHPEYLWLLDNEHSRVAVSTDMGITSRSTIDVKVDVANKILGLDYKRPENTVKIGDVLTSTLINERFQMILENVMHFNANPNEQDPYNNKKNTTIQLRAE